ncbi:MAG: RNA methyltransferase [Actinomycetota bacterium]|nr:RNA methyltransferase [Actinomycetota bacterium]
MAAPIEICDPADPRLSDFRDLARADRRPDRPGGRGLVIAEGIPVVRRLLASRYPLRAILGVASRLETLSGELHDLAEPVYLASADVMATAVGFHLNRGVLASADRLPTVTVERLLDGSAAVDGTGLPLSIGTARRIAVLEGVNDHENLGSVFRNAAALGVDAILLGPDCSDPLYRRSIRVSMGHVLAVPFAELAASPRFAAWPDAIRELRAAGFCVLALTPRPDSQALNDLDPARYARTAVLVGAEGPGLSEAALDAADLRVRIPMRPGVDSLNVATAAAIAFAHLAPPM